MPLLIVPATAASQRLSPSPVGPCGTKLPPSQHPGPLQSSPAQSTPTTTTATPIHPARLHLDRPSHRWRGHGMRYHQREIQQRGETHILHPSQQKNRQKQCRGAQPRLSKHYLSISRINPCARHPSAQLHCTVPLALAASGLRVAAAACHHPSTSPEGGWSISLSRILSLLFRLSSINLASHPPPHRLAISSLSLPHPP